jgi:hypothetical protein
VNILCGQMHSPHIWNCVVEGELLALGLGELLLGLGLGELLLGFVLGELKVFKLRQSYDHEPPPTFRHSPESYHIPPSTLTQSDWVYNRQQPALSCVALG